MSQTILIKHPKQPKTRAKLADFRYGTSNHNIFGHAYDPCRCARIIFDPLDPAVWWQCGHRAGKGPNSLWCGRHAVDPVVTSNQVDKPIPKRPKARTQQDLKETIGVQRKEIDRLLSEVSRLTKLNAMYKDAASSAMALAEASLYRGQHAFSEFTHLKKRLANTFAQ